MGNHDLKNGKILDTNNTLDYFHSLEKKINFHLLEDETIHLMELDLIGINPPFPAYYIKYKDNWISYLINTIENCKNKEKINSNHYNMLIVHSPELLFLLEEYTNNYDNKKDLADLIQFLTSLDLFVCGHTHGGLIPKYLQKLKIVRNNWGVMASEGDTLKESALRKYDKCRGIHNIFNGKLIISEGITKWCQPNIIFGAIDLMCAKDITTIKLTKKQKN